MTKNVFILNDQWKNIDTSSLDNYDWKIFRDSEFPRFSRLPYSFRKNKWEDDTPKIAYEAYEQSVIAFKKINPFCNVIRIEKCLIQKSLSGNNLSQQDIHRDDHRADRWTALWFISGNGNTKLFNDWDITSEMQEILFNAGSVVIFPSGTWHGPGFSTHGWRIIVNNVFYIENLVEPMNNIRPLCRCKQSKEYPYCDSSHNEFYNLT